MYRSMYILVVGCRGFSLRLLLHYHRLPSVFNNHRGYRRRRRHYGCGCCPCSRRRDWTGRGRLLPFPASTLPFPPILFFGMDTHVPVK